MRNRNRTQYCSTLLKQRAWEGSKEPSEPQTQALALGQLPSSPLPPRPARAPPGSFQTCSWTPHGCCKGARGKRGGGRSQARQGLDAVRRLEGNYTGLWKFSICKVGPWEKVGIKPVSKTFWFCQIRKYFFGTFLTGLFFINFDRLDKSCTMPGFFNASLITNQVPHITAWHSWMLFCSLRYPRKQQSLAASRSQRARQRDCSCTSAILFFPLCTFETGDQASIRLFICHYCS